MEMVFWFSFLIIIASWIGFVVWKQKNWFAMHMGLCRVPWNFPIVGNAYLLIDRMKAMQKYGRFAIQHGGLSSCWLGARHFIVIADAKLAEIILKTCLDKDDIMQIAHELFGNGSIFAPLHIWRLRRKVIAPTFSLKNLHQFVEVFSRQSITLVEQMRKATGKGTVSVWKYLTTYTMDSVCESTLGVKVEAQYSSDHPFLVAFEQHCLMASPRILHPIIAQKAYVYFPIYKLYLQHIHCMWDFVDKVISNKRQELKKRKEEKRQGKNGTQETPVQKTFLDLFIESSGGSSGFTDLELREETLVLLLAGTDTSAVGSAFTCLMLARHPEVQEKAYEEISQVLGESDGTITPADLPKLKYLEAVLKETMRLYPPVPIIVRKVDKDFILPSGLTVVKGTAILMNIWAVHRNPTYWGEDAENFRPERFLGADSIHAAAFIPFSHGPRSCLGYQYAMMSMKTAMANLIRNYRLLPATPVSDKNSPLRVKFDIMMKHVENFELLVEHRK